MLSSQGLRGMTSRCHAHRQGIPHASHAGMWGHFNTALNSPQLSHDSPVQSRHSSGSSPQLMELNSPKWVRIGPRMRVTTHCPSGNNRDLSKDPVSEEHEAPKGSSWQQPAMSRSHALGDFAGLLPLRGTVGTI